MKFVLRLFVALAIAFVAMFAATSAQAQWLQVGADVDGSPIVKITGHVYPPFLAKAFQGQYRESVTRIDPEDNSELTWQMIAEDPRNTRAVLPICYPEGGPGHGANQFVGAGNFSVWASCPAERKTVYLMEGTPLYIPLRYVETMDVLKKEVQEVRDCVKSARTNPSSCTIPQVAAAVGMKMTAMDAPKVDAKTPVANVTDSSAEVAELKARVAALEKTNNRLTSERDVARKDRDDLRGKMEDAKSPSAGMSMEKVAALAVVLICAMIIIGLVMFRRGKTRGRKIERKKADAELGTMELNYQEKVTDRDNRIATLQCEIATVTHALEAVRAEKSAPIAVPRGFVTAVGLAASASVAAVATISAMEPTLSPKPVDALPEQVLSPELMKTTALPDASANGNGNGARSRNLSVESLGWTREQRDEYDRDKRARNAGTPIVAPANGQNGQAKKNGTLIVEESPEMSGLRMENVALKAHVADLERKLREADEQSATNGGELTKREAELASANAAKNYAEGELAAAKLSREQVDEKLTNMRIAWHDQRRAMRACMHDSEDPLSRIGMADDPTLGGRPRGEPPLALEVAQANLYTALAVVINEGTTPESVAAALKEWFGSDGSAPQSGPFEADHVTTIQNGTRLSQPGLPVGMIADNEEKTTVFKVADILQSAAEQDAEDPPLTDEQRAAAKRATEGFESKSWAHNPAVAGPLSKLREAVPARSPHVLIGDPNNRPVRSSTDKPPAHLTESSVSGVQLMDPEKKERKTLPPPPPSMARPNLANAGPPNGGDDHDPSDMRATVPPGAPSNSVRVAFAGDAEQPPAEAGAKIS